MIRVSTYADSEAVAAKQHGLLASGFQMQLNPQHVSIANLFNGRLFRIPDYQRAYAWERKQRDDLFNDIDEVKRSGREHFMATVVALARNVYTIGADEFKAVDLVDGQQRITTLVILLKSIEKALDGVTPVSAKIKREISELLVKGDEHTMLLLQTNHDSSSIFSSYIRNGTVSHGSAITQADKNVEEAIVECEKYVNAWAEQDDLVSLVALLRNKLSLIYHEISDEALVYRVFEVLNSRGLDVKWIDKLKSQLLALIFEHVEGPVRAEAAHAMQVVWQDVYRKLGLRTDLGDEALRFAGTFALEARSTKIITESQAAGELVRSAFTDLKTISAVGDRLKQAVNAVHEIDQDARLRAVTRIIHARFVAVSIMLRQFDDLTRRDLLRVWEWATFRIFGLGGADTRNKRGDYVKLGYDIYHSKIEAKEIKEKLRSLASGYDLKAKFSEGDYWSDCYNGWSEEFRYIMFRYEEHISKKAGLKLNSGQWNKIWLEEPSKSIEHIQPQSTLFSYIHHLGNLCMLPPGVNSSLKDLPPKEKVEAYDSCGLRSTVQVGKLIDKAARWTEEMVRSRGSEIETFVLNEWGSPNPSTP